MLGLVAEVFASRAIFGVSSRALFYSNLTTTLQGFWKTEAWSLRAGIQMQVFCSRAHGAPGMCWREGSEVRHAVLALPGTSVPQFPYFKKEQYLFRRVVVRNGCCINANAGHKVRVLYTFHCCFISQCCRSASEFSASLEGHSVPLASSLFSLRWRAMHEANTPPLQRAVLSSRIFCLLQPHRKGYGEALRTHSGGWAPRSP